jgi:Kef-type K+ transport system membrane component KefB
MAAGQNADAITSMVFVDVALITTLGALLGIVARRFRQPAVVGEIIAGLTLGPSLLGLLPGDLPGRLFPAAARPQLSTLANVGLIFFLFVMGLEFEFTSLRGRGRTVAFVSAASIVIPFGLGAGTGALLYRWHDRIGDRHVDFVPFVLFIAAAMSITAFPVLARIIAERDLNRTVTGALSMSCAAINDFIAWCLLAVVVAIVAATGPGGPFVMLAKSAIFFVGLVFVVRPLVRRAIRSRHADGKWRALLFPAILGCLLVSAWATAKIGLHPVFGAFAFGAVLPREEFQRHLPEIPAQAANVGYIFLPIFFVTTGLSTDITGLNGRGVVELALVIAVACVGKVGGVTTASRISGLDGRSATRLGVLMNTRGLTELIILNVGLSLGVLDKPMFTMMVIMALATTLMTGPLLSRYPGLVAEDLVDETEMGPSELREPAIEARR